MALYVYTCMCTHVHKYVYTCTQVYTYMCTCVHVYTCTHVYTYTHVLRHKDAERQSGSEVDGQKDRCKEKQKDGQTCTSQSGAAMFTASMVLSPGRRARRQLPSIPWQVHEQLRTSRAPFESVTWPTQQTSLPTTTHPITV